ncbi:hypothetical protein B0H13DRAFT_2453463 [Mycena leptocephala]|nr:hypothetical protein B0H13DRAFT_2453463 [Mycena leptocephala]
MSDIIVWMEYNASYKLVCDRVNDIIPYDPQNVGSFQHLIAHMLPLLMMHRRRIPRESGAIGSFVMGSTGSSWCVDVEFGVQRDLTCMQASEIMPPEISTVGYHLAYEKSLCGIAMAQGIQHKVVNIGLNIKRLSLAPYGSVTAYVAAMAPRFTPLEMQSLEQEIGDKNVLRPWKRLEFNIGPTHETVRGDNHPLQGWEFRTFPILDKHYICVCAFFRAEESKLQWYTEDTDEYKKWVQFLSIDQMVVPELFLS